MQTFVLAGGCFWCLDAVYRVLKGVESVVSGYTGGETQNPSYEAVCTGRTGHAEAVAVTFDGMGHGQSRHVCVNATAAFGLA